MLKNLNVLNDELHDHREEVANQGLTRCQTSRAAHGANVSRGGSQRGHEWGKPDRSRPVLDQG